GRHAGHADRGRRDPAAHRLRRLRRLWGGRAGRRRGVHLFHQPQLQGTNGPHDLRGLSGVSLHGGRKRHRRPSLRPTTLPDGRGMSGNVTGRAWTFGDNIDTDVLAPGIYMKLPVEEVAQHCLEAVDPEFAARVQPGDIVVGGENFGMGSSREQAPQALKILGVGAVLAKSFARIFYRNALNLGLPALFFREADEVSAGDRLELDL